MIAISSLLHLRAVPTGPSILKGTTCREGEERVRDGTPPATIAWLALRRVANKRELVLQVII
jgi:hypothetical protein